MPPGATHPDVHPHVDGVHVRRELADELVVEQFAYRAATDVLALVLLHLRFQRSAVDPATADQQGDPPLLIALAGPRRRRIAPLPGSLGAQPADDGAGSLWLRFVVPLALCVDRDVAWALDRCDDAPLRLPAPTRRAGPSGLPWLPGVGRSVALLTAGLLATIGTPAAYASALAATATSTATGAGASGSGAQTRPLSTAPSSPSASPSSPTAPSSPSPSPSSPSGSPSPAPQPTSQAPDPQPSPPPAPAPVGQGSTAGAQPISAGGPGGRAHSPGAPGLGAATGGTTLQSAGSTPFNAASLSLRPPAFGMPDTLIQSFEIPPFLLPIYQAAGTEYGVPWQVLAAINEIETDYGRNLNVSSAGAEGWMQFLPATWQLYGVDATDSGKADPYNPVDAIFAAARYLQAAGAQTNLAQAIYAYNHAGWYVSSVLVRAQLIAQLPQDLVDSLTGLAEGRFPVTAIGRHPWTPSTLRDPLAHLNAHASTANQGTGASPSGAGALDAVGAAGGGAQSGGPAVDIAAAPGAPVVAVNDGRVVALGHSQTLGRYIVLQDVYGNEYVYAQLGSLARRYSVPAPIDAQASQRTTAAQASQSTTATQGAGVATPASAHASASASPAAPVKERLFAHPARPAALAAGGERELGALDGSAYAAGVSPTSGGELLVPLRRGARVSAGTVIGHMGRGDGADPPRLRFAIRPAGTGAPQIDPSPILQSWHLLAQSGIFRVSAHSPFVGPHARTPTTGQLLLMSKQTLQDLVLADTRIKMPPCARAAIRGGGVDRRALVALELLAGAGLEPTIGKLECERTTAFAADGVLARSSGTAIEITAINGLSLRGQQGPGSLADRAVRLLATLQGTTRPSRIITSTGHLDLRGVLARSGFADRIRIVFEPLFGQGGRPGGSVEAILQPDQWTALIQRLDVIANPRVAPQPGVPRSATPVK